MNEISMGSFQVCDVLSILFKLEKPLVEHLEGFILLPKEGEELQNFFKTLNQKFQLKNSKKIPPLDQQKLVHRWWEECL
jgi:hypothetical protein